jgi:hypothetical protein
VGGGRGNSSDAELCEEGDNPRVLLAQDGSAFKNAGQCTSHGAQGGQIAGVNIVAGPVSGGIFTATYCGFGLKPIPWYFSVRGSRDRCSAEEPADRESHGAPLSPAEC